MFSITAICVAGVGSSVFCKELLGDALNMLGYDPSYFKINADEVSMARGVNADVVVTSTALYDQIKDIMEEKGIPVIKLVSICAESDKMAEGLKPYIEKAEEEGRVYKIGEAPVKEKKKGFGLFKKK